VIEERAVKYNGPPCIRMGGHNERLNKMLVEDSRND